jgi:hypothetical protein
MGADEEKLWVRLPEAKRIAGCSTNTIYDKTAAGKVRTQKIGNRRYWNRDDLKRLTFSRLSQRGGKMGSFSRWHGDARDANNQDTATAGPQNESNA